MGGCQSSMAAHLTEPLQRDARFRDPEGKLNVAAYLVALHDASKVFKFCGSHKFQLQLSPALREHLNSVAEQGASSSSQPVVFEAERFCEMPDYQSDFQGSAAADNIRVFHGREVRNSPNANGGQGKVLHLSMAGAEDSQGWTPDELEEYNGWKHDSSRNWRKAPQYELEGFAGYSQQFDSNAYGLHHRFYLHWDSREVMWLSAEDGCEGEPWPEK